MFKNQFKVSKKFMIFLSYFIPFVILTTYGIDVYSFQGPKFYDPRAKDAVELFQLKCSEYKIEAICKKGFDNLIKLNIVDKVWFQTSLDPNITTIGLAEFSIFTSFTKISIDKRLMVDRMLLDSTIIHELGHAVLNLGHDDSKPAIMNSQVPDIDGTDTSYNFLIDEMFKDFVKNIK